MLFYQNTLIDIEAIREYAATQSYDSLKIRLNKLLFELNIEDANDCRVSTNWEEHSLYSHYISLKTIDNIRAGASIVNMSFVGLITSYWIESVEYASEIYCEPKGVDYFDEACGIDEEILHGYDLRRFFYVYYALQDLNIRANILDKLIWELGLIDSEDSPDSVIVLEYLTRFRELIQSQPEQTLQKQPQEQIYSIPTSLTEKQLVALLGRLKDKKFVAPEQTEEDFLNAFNSKAPKQGKIKWIKRGEKAKGVTKTAMVNFVYLMYPKLHFDQDKYNIVAAVFDIEPTRADLSRGKKSEFSNELQQIITY